MIREMKIQLEYLNMPVYDILKEVKSKAYLSDLVFLENCSDMIKNGSDFPTAWKISIENTSLCYKRNEKDRLLHLGMNLGASNTESQLSILDMHSLYFDEFLSKAKAKKQKQGNLSVALAALMGCMIFILII